MSVRRTGKTKQSGGLVAARFAIIPAIVPASSSLQGKQKVVRDAVHSTCATLPSDCEFLACNGRLLS